MPLLTIQEFADSKGISRQAVEDRIKRGTLDVVVKTVKVQKRFIQVEDSVKPE